LGVHEVHLGRLEKLSVYQDILRRHGLRDEQVCYVGDDLLDLSILERCGLPVTVPAACAEVKAIAALVTERDGGRGAVREVIEALLQAKGLWAGIVNAKGLVPKPGAPA
jgi:3-deoxy-D-manno-octulosonate 8-phosphate phosphatase (KDO 8-P phosphatase)